MLSFGGGTLKIKALTYLLEHSKNEDMTKKAEAEMARMAFSSDGGLFGDADDYVSEDHSNDDA